MLIMSRANLFQQQLIGGWGGRGLKPSVSTAELEGITVICFVSVCLPDSSVTSLELKPIIVTNLSQKQHSEVQQYQQAPVLHSRKSKHHGRKAEVTCGCIERMTEPILNCRTGKQRVT